MFTIFIWDYFYLEGAAKEITTVSESYLRCLRQWQETKAVLELIHKLGTEKEHNHR